MFHQREQDICVLCNIEHHLGKIKRKAIKAGYQDNTMIVSGVESLLNVCKYNHDSEGHIYFTIMLITYILPRRNSFYELIAEITNNFIEYREVASQTRSLNLEKKTSRINSQISAPVNSALEPKILTFPDFGQTCTRILLVTTIAILAISLSYLTY